MLNKFCILCSSINRHKLAYSTLLEFLELDKDVIDLETEIHFEVRETFDLTLDRLNYHLKVIAEIIDNLYNILKTR